LVYHNTASISTDIIILCVASIIKLYYTLGATYKSVLLQAIHSRVIPLEASHMITKVLVLIKLILSSFCIIKLQSRTGTTIIDATVYLF
jgi:hypothetical protein